VPKLLSHVRGTYVLKCVYIPIGNVSTAKENWYIQNIQKLLPHRQSTDHDRYSVERTENPQKTADLPYLHYRQHTHVDTAICYTGHHPGRFCRPKFIMPTERAEIRTHMRTCEMNKAAEATSARYKDSGKNYQLIN